MPTLGTPMPASISSNGHQLLTIPQVAELLQCTRQHVYHLINGGTLRCVNISASNGGRTRKRVRISDIDSFLSASADKDGPTPAETMPGPGRAT